MWREVVALELQLHGLRVALESLALASPSPQPPPWPMAAQADPLPAVQAWTGIGTQAPRSARTTNARLPDWLCAYA